MSNTFNNKFTVYAQLLYVGERTDFDYRPFPAQQLTLSAYSLTNVSLKYAVSGSIFLKARIDNLLDEVYEEVFTYGTSSTAFYGGVEFNL